MTYETIPTFAGRHLLAILHDFNVAEGWGLVYRGGAHPVQSVTPDTPYWWVEDGDRYADSAHPVVCADPTPLVPAFCAVAPNGQREYYGKESGGVHFGVVAGAAGEFYKGLGYVAVFEGEDFAPFEGGLPPGWPYGAPLRVPEMRASSEQMALCNIAISARDFFDLLEADGSDSTLEFCSRLAAS